MSAIVLVVIVIYSAEDAAHSLTYLFFVFETGFLCVSLAILELVL